MVDMKPSMFCLVNVCKKLMDRKAHILDPKLCDCKHKSLGLMGMSQHISLSSYLRKTHQRILIRKYLKTLTRKMVPQLDNDLRSDMFLGHR